MVYTCYQPVDMATAADLALKRRAFQEYRVTTHWPAAGVCMPQEGARDRTDFEGQRTRDKVPHFKPHSSDALLQHRSHGPKLSDHAFIPQM